jgi:hypothetical protein
MAFADSDDLILFYDSRRCRELASDTGTPIALGDLETDPVITAVLAKATEQVLSHARYGKRYSEEDLQELADDAERGWMLRSLTCDLAFASLIMRRGTGAADVDRLSPNYKMALATLQQLAAGAMIFPRLTGPDEEQTADAGTASIADLTVQVTTPSAQCSWSAMANRALLPNSPTTGPCNC